MSQEKSKKDDRRANLKLVAEAQNAMVLRNQAP